MAGKTRTSAPGASIYTPRVVSINQAIAASRFSKFCTCFHFAILSACRLDSVAVLRSSQALGSFESLSRSSKHSLNILTQIQMRSSSRRLSMVKFREACNTPSCPRVSTLPALFSTGALCVVHVSRSPADSYSTNRDWMLISCHPAYGRLQRPEVPSKRGCCSLPGWGRWALHRGCKT